MAIGKWRKKIQFWHDNWANAMPLKDLFPRVYALALNRDCSISTMGQFLDSSDSSWCWNIPTISALRGRSLSEFQELTSLLSNYAPSHYADEFIWSESQSPRFSVANLSELLSPSTAILPSDVIDIIWLKWTPPRVRIFSWKLANNALPISWNLLCRGIIPRDFDPLCPLCKTELESQDHLFLSCHLVLPIWYKIMRWWSLSFTLPSSTIQFLQQCQAVSCHPGLNHLFQMVCICSTWTIWYGRNNFVFNNIAWDVESLFHFIQSKTFAWIQGLESEKLFTPSDWFLFPQEVAKIF